VNEEVLTCWGLLNQKQTKNYIFEQICKTIIWAEKEKLSMVETVTCFPFSDNRFR
jgi:hypothetical protein